MIRCLLAHISHNLRGQAIRQDREIASDVLSIGRGSECRIHLPDHRVGLHQANIHHGDDGRLYISAEESHLIEIDGHMVQNSPLSVGMRINIGPYALTITEISDAENITLELERIVPEEPVATPTAPTSLEATGLSMRKPAFWLSACLTLLFIVLPVAYNLHPGFHAMVQRHWIGFDEPLNAGNMSPGHRALSRKCNTCHEKPFTAVSNQVCEKCHNSVAHHIPDPVLHGKVFNPIRCSSCHLDHRGRTGLIRHDSQQCVDCHGKIKSHHTESKLVDITDFSSDHPAFQLTIRTGPDSAEKRIRQTDKSRLVEHSGLKFSHQEHFDKALIELQGDKTRDITCSDCHVSSDSGVGFKPMTMPQTCQQSKCHSMQLDPPIEGRTVPHASETAVMTELRELFASRAINSVYKEGVTVDDLKRARQWAESESMRNATRLFTTEEEGTCLECHEITPAPDDKLTPWLVAPVRINEHWLPRSRFPHDKHSTEKCTSCHNVKNSKKSADVAIPSITKCRECHVGIKQAKTRVSSSCDTCHNFHDVKLQNTHPASTKQDDQE